MGGYLAALATLAGPMVARVLMALGFSVVTVTGVAFGWGAVKSQLLSNLNAMVGRYVQLAGLGGAWWALGAILGACSFVVALWGLTQATKVVGSAS